MTALMAREERALRVPGSTSHGVQHTKETKIMEHLKRQASETPLGPGVSRGPTQRSALTGFPEVQHLPPGSSPHSAQALVQSSRRTLHCTGSPGTFWF